MSGAITGKPGGRREDDGRLGRDRRTTGRTCSRERRARPADPEIDMVTHLMRSEIDGVPLPDDEILDLMVTLTLGSLDTLKSQLGWCMYHLATHDEDRRRLVEDPGLVPTAVEEFLRAYPIIGMARKVTQGRRLPRLPHEEGRHGAADDPGRHPRPAAVPRAGEGRHRAHAQPAHRLRRERAPLPRLAPRPGGAAHRDHRVAPAHPRVPDRRRRAAHGARRPDRAAVPAAGLGGADGTA